MNVATRYYEWSEIQITFTWKDGSRMILEHCDECCTLTEHDRSGCKKCHERRQPRMPDRPRAPQIPNYGDLPYERWR